MPRNLPVAFLFAAVAGIAMSPAIAASPVIVVTPLSDHPSANVTVSGSGFGASEAVDIYLDTSDKQLAFTDSSGKFSKHLFKVPADALPGEHWVTAVGRRDGAAAQKLFTVATAWAEFGFKSNGKRYNPYENVISTSNVKELDTAWSAAVNMGVSSPPAIANGIAYVGSWEGKVYAFDELTGANLWAAAMDSYTYDSSPAVANGIVYVGTWGGTLYAFDTLTGANLWTAATGSPIFNSSPAVVSGVVYIGSIDGKLHAFNATTGAALWDAMTGGAIESSPAVVNGLVYVGSLDGKLYAFNAATGALAWNATTGDAIGSSPAVANGVVYVGSDDAKLYAIDAANGGLVWSAVLSGAAGSSPAVANGIVYAGSNGNWLYALDAATGALLWSADTGPFEFSSPAIANGIVYVGRIGNGTIRALNPLTGATLWTAETAGFVDELYTIVADGMVFAGAEGGRLYAYALDGGNNAIYKHRHTTPPSFSTLHPDHHLKLAR